MAQIQLFGTTLIPDTLTVIEQDYFYDLSTRADVEGDQEGTNLW